MFPRKKERPRLGLLLSRGSTLKVPPLTGHLLRCRTFPSVIFHLLAVERFPSKSTSNHRVAVSNQLRLIGQKKRPDYRLPLNLSTAKNSNFARLCWPCQKIPFISRSMRVPSMATLLALYPVTSFFSFNGQLVRVSSPKCSRGS
jgi:hypothetical protein